MTLSELQRNPKSVVLETGYINVYSELNPKERRQLDFKRRYKKENPSWDESMVFLSNYFHENAPENCVVLDAGCGNGNYIIDENRKKISWATGIDASEESTSKNICLDEKLVGNLEQLPFDDNSFDVVTSLWVLEHLENPEKVFNEINRVLKPGGFFMFATPNKTFFPLVLNQWIGNTGLNNLINKKLYGRNEVDIFKTHYKANTKKTLWKISNGFNINELRYNFDPSYTSFDNITYEITKNSALFFGSLGFSIFDAHLIGILTKQ